MSMHTINTLTNDSGGGGDTVGGNNTQQQQQINNQEQQQHYIDDNQQYNNNNSNSNGNSNGNTNLIDISFGSNGGNNGLNTSFQLFAGNSPFKDISNTLQLFNSGNSNSSNGGNNNTSNNGSMFLFNDLNQSNGDSVMIDQQQQHQQQEDNENDNDNDDNNSFIDIDQLVQSKNQTKHRTRSQFNLSYLDFDKLDEYLESKLPVEADEDGFVNDHILDHCNNEEYKKFLLNLHLDNLNNNNNGNNGNGGGDETGQGNLNISDLNGIDPTLLNSYRASTMIEDEEDDDYVPPEDPSDEDEDELGDDDQDVLKVVVEDDNQKVEIEALVTDFMENEAKELSDNNYLNILEGSYTDTLIQQNQQTLAALLALPPPPQYSILNSLNNININNNNNTDLIDDILNNNQLLNNQLNQNSNNSLQVPSTPMIDFTMDTDNIFEDFNLNFNQFNNPTLVQQPQHFDITNSSIGNSNNNFNIYGQPNINMTTFQPSTQQHQQPQQTNRQISNVDSTVNQMNGQKRVLDNRITQSPLKLPLHLTSTTSTTTTMTNPFSTPRTPSRPLDFNRTLVSSSKPPLLFNNHTTPSKPILLFTDANMQQLKKQVSNHYQLLLQVLLKLRITNQNEAIKAHKQEKKRKKKLLKSGVNSSGNGTNEDGLQMTNGVVLGELVIECKKMLDEIYFGYKRQIEKNFLSQMLIHQIESPSKMFTTRSSAKRAIIHQVSLYYDDNYLKLHPYVDELLSEDPNPNQDTMNVILNVFNDCFTEELKYKNDNLSRLKFTPSEDVLLKVGLERYGPNWQIIKERLLPTKTIDQIFHRFKNKTSTKSQENVLKEFITGNKCSKDDEQTILTGVSKYGKNWEKIARKLLPGRNPQQIAHYFEKKIRKDKREKALQPKKEKEKEKQPTKKQKINNNNNQNNNQNNGNNQNHIIIHDVDNDESTNQPQQHLILTTKQQKQQLQRHQKQKGETDKDLMNRNLLNTSIYYVSDENHDSDNNDDDGIDDGGIYRIQQQQSQDNHEINHVHMNDDDDTDTVMETNHSQSPFNNNNNHIIHTNPKILNITDVNNNNNNNQPCNNNIRSDNLQLIEGVVVKWTREEDKILLLAVKEKGSKSMEDHHVWEWMSSDRIPSKSPLQIQQRYLQLVELLKKQSSQLRK